MVSLCKKLKDMVKDEKKGVEEYKELQDNINKMGFSEEIEYHVDTLVNIEIDENRHHEEIKKMMKYFKCK